MEDQRSSSPCAALPFRNGHAVEIDPYSGGSAEAVMMHDGEGPDAALLQGENAPFNGKPGR